MTLRVYDYHTDLRNVHISPEIRSRFEYLKPGTHLAIPHSHDLGTEVWLVLQGTVEFDVEGEKAVLKPGNMIVALPGEKHTVRVIGDEPVIQYLSVTPHIEPTHTRYNQRGEELPPHYGTHLRSRPAEAPTVPVKELLQAHLAAVQQLVETIRVGAEVQTSAAQKLESAAASGDSDGAKAELDRMWLGIRSASQAYYAMLGAWNELAEEATRQRVCTQQ